MQNTTGVMELSLKEEDHLQRKCIKDPQSELEEGGISKVTSISYKDKLAKNIRLCSKDVQKALCINYIEEDLDIEDDP